jgi:hypothetical protein
MRSRHRSPGRTQASAEQRPQQLPHEVGSRSDREPTSAGPALRAGGLSDGAVTPATILRLQHRAGNQAVITHLKGANSQRQPAVQALQRHDMPPRPATLEAPAVTGQKQPWSVDSILTQAELDELKEQLKALIPADASESPDERVKELKFTDCHEPSSMPKGYEEAAAKVTDDGTVYLNNSLNDYYHADGSPKVDKIKTTIVHEAMHAVSANHTGLQGYANLMSESPDPGDITSPEHQPDEAVTEYFSRKVYEAVFGSDAKYETAYWVPDRAGERQLPSAWTGQMVDVLKSVLGIDDAELKIMYFTEPEDLKKELTDEKKAELRKKWYALVGQETFAQHGVVTPRYRDTLLREVINEKRAELDGKSKKAQLTIVRDGLTARGVTKEQMPGEWPIKQKIEAA